mmetsp:Transcript_36998/g.82252  ORF Transcript_36998/g.82252 Transcript_36998/m.82252 type:complete len:95 (+) Transcript_36998:41-325(+)|eukprot:CAMPEP_0202902724 /NCGR_PEP_ID=MMETSP1392-20130828/17019_1 /ASSEMBLY_ACC=CAM_ASM_000868 /TAXON_ID=225041 /ORGANISM="Chlamydomonas chlamydogama, Strain SAG 11-48b" /LENGTH=94 /DNA_ID=CAMNT_0049589531 /DNA_START=27 /DNA_END=311 /DNA_ORIENTATION=-
MDALTFAAFEQRATEAETRLNVLETKLLAGAVAAGKTDELLALKELLVKAREETVKLQEERNAAVAENAKLKYQVKHLKRAVVEADVKLASAGK